MGELVEEVEVLILLIGVDITKQILLQTWVMDVGDASADELLQYLYLIRVVPSSGAMSAAGSG